MKIELGSKGLTESGWIDYGFQNYYALLNCGFRLRPTAGTASGVHPVPLGFGRVYVNLPDGFSYDSWMESLGAGRTFGNPGTRSIYTGKTSAVPRSSHTRACLEARSDTRLIVSLCRSQ